jgi:hypothetical protein
MGHWSRQMAMPAMRVECISQAPQKRLLRAQGRHQPPTYPRVVRAFVREGKGGTLLACIHCGHFSQFRTDAQGRACPGKPANRTHFNRPSSLKHPARTQVHLSGPYRACGIPAVPSTAGTLPGFQAAAAPQDAQASSPQPPHLAGFQWEPVNEEVLASEPDWHSATGIEAEYRYIVSHSGGI